MSGLLQRAGRLASSVCGSAARSRRDVVRPHENAIRVHACVWAHEAPRPVGSSMRGSISTRATQVPCSPLLERERYLILNILVDCAL